MKCLPSDTNAERMILGSVMLDENLMHAARPIVEVADFSTDRHQNIWRSACSVYDSGKVVDRITLTSTIPSEFGYVLDLDSGLPIIPALDSYIRIVKEKAALRRLITAGNDLVNRAMAGAETALALTESISGSMMAQTTGERATGLKSAKQVMEKYGAEKLLSPRKARGLMFPWGWMNHWTSGMLEAELWVLAGDTSSGKTSAMIQHAIGAARRNKATAIFSLEVGDLSLFQKATYQLAGVDSERAKRGRLTAEERGLAMRAAEEISELPIYFDTESNTTLAIHSSLRRRRASDRIDHVIVDYLQLLGNSGRHDTRAQAVGQNAWALKMIATEFQVPVLLLSQFSRKEKTARDREPHLGDLKESGDIENHANGVWFLHRTSEEDSDRIPVKFMLPKQREGRRNIVADFTFLPQYQRFVENDERNYED